MQEISERTRRVQRCRNDQRDKLEKAHLEVCLALDCISDTMACSGSDVVASWLDPAHIRLCRAKVMLSEVLREGGEV
jgi:hypothetical protein